MAAWLAAYGVVGFIVAVAWSVVSEDHSRDEWVYGVCMALWPFWAIYLAALWVGGFISDVGYTFIEARREDQRRKKGNI